jgi:hypothetical protein
VPSPAGGADIETKMDFDFGSGQFFTSPALSATNYMSTAPDVRSTMEFAFGQLPLLGYSFSIDSGPPPSTTGAHFSATASVDGVPLWGRLARKQTFNTAVYQNRDAQARPLVRTRFDNSSLTSYGFSDSVGDVDPRVEGYTLRPSQFQTISYTYAAGTGNMNAPTSAGWNLQLNTPFNPTPGTAFIKPPTFGARPSPISSINIQFTHPTPGLSLTNLRFENLISTGLTLNTSDGGLNWTLAGNLAAQQSSDGDYAVKLFALGSGVLSGGSQLIGSIGIKWTLDTLAPSVSMSNFEYESRQAMNFKFTEDVSASLNVADIVLKNVTNNTTIPSGAMAMVYDTQTNTATVTFPGLANGILPNGTYAATIAANDVTDVAGNALIASHQLDFFFIQGDADHNGVINFDDYARIDFGFNNGLTGFSNGDFNYDGVINFDDYALIDFAFNNQGRERDDVRGPIGLRQL